MALIISAADVALADTDPPTGAVQVLRGRVEFPDGRPAAGATVTAVALCAGLPCGGDSVVAGRDGDFEIPVGTRLPNGTFVRPSARFPSACDRIRFSAAHRAGLWLKTGLDVFYLRPSGTEPEIRWLPGKDPEWVVIRLGEQGGEVKIQVWDIGSSRFIHAVVSLVRQDTGGRYLGSLQTETGADGSAVAVLLPAGAYAVAIEQYPCGERTFFATNAEFPLTVASGERASKVISLDTRILDARTSHDNPEGSRCGQ